MSVVRKQTKALWSMIYRHTECVRGVCENRFFIDFHPQHKIYRRHSSVWVLSENRPQQQKNASGTSSFYSSNLKTASESPVFYNTKRSVASPAPSTIINYNKEIIIFNNNNNNNNNNSPWIGILIVMCSYLKWTTPHFCGGFLLKTTTIGFSHTPKPSPMTSGHHTSWNSDMKDNHSLVSRERDRVLSENSPNNKKTHLK